MLPQRARHRHPPLNDASEIRSLELALGAALPSVPLSSTKAATGHLFGAGGAVEAIVTLAALRDRLAPPTLGLAAPDPELGRLRTSRPPAR